MSTPQKPAAELCCIDGLPCHFANEKFSRCRTLQCGLSAKAAYQRGRLAGREEAAVRLEAAGKEIKDLAHDVASEKEFNANVDRLRKDTHMKVWSDPTTKTIHFEGVVAQADIEQLGSDGMKRMLLTQTDGAGTASDWLLMLDYIFCCLSRRVEGKR